MGHLTRVWPLCDLGGFHVSRQLMRYPLGGKSVSEYVMISCATQDACCCFVRQWGLRAELICEKNEIAKNL